MSQPAIVPLRPKLIPIPDQLRQWADDLEAGNLPMPFCLLFISDDGEGYEMRSVGEMTNMRAAHMLCKALKMVCE